MMASEPAVKCGIFFLILNLILFLGFEKKERKNKNAINLLQVNLDLIRIERNNQIDNGANIFSSHFEYAAKLPSILKS